MKKRGKKTMEQALIQKQNGQIINQIIADINAVPELADLPEKAKRLVAKSVIFDRYKDELRGKADAAKIDYEKEKATYLKKACRSAGTSRVYEASLARFEQWCHKNEIAPMEMTPKDADDFIYALSAEGRSSASVRLDISAASAFFTWMERRHKSVRNPFRGTRARPVKKAKKELLIPSESEVETIIDHFKGSTKAAVIVMARVGLRVGALTSLTIRDGKYTCQTKGKEQKGTLSPEVLKAVKKLGAKPFADRTAGGISESVKAGIKKLYEAGKIRARYSNHDLRHAFAVSEYRKDKDIYRVSQLLGHCNISITQTYLRGLGYGD